MADSDPHLPAPYEEADIMAIRALRDGVANEGQQQRAFHWIVFIAAKAEDMSYRPGGHEADRASAFAEGKRFVGKQVQKLASDDFLALFKKGETNRKSRGK